MTTKIIANGSKWAGEGVDGIEKLVELLGREPLDPTHEAYGNFIRRFSDCEWPDGVPEYATEKMWLIDGNFLNVSHVFLIHTDDPDVAEALGGAIYKNKRREDYRKARSDKWPRIKDWVAVGRRNAWIRTATDPEFDEMSISPCCDLEMLAEKILEGNWCLGQGFFCGDLCLINQIEGGDEWLTIKKKTAFESLSCELIGREKLIEMFKKFIAAKNARGCQGGRDA